MKYRFLLVAFAFVGATSCGVNNLAKYNLNDQTMYFEEKIAPQAQTVQLAFDQPPVNNNTKKESTLETLGRVATSLASGVLSADVESKLRKAASPDSMVQAVSSGFESTLIKFYNVKPDNNIRGAYSFIAETLLEESKVISNPQGVFMYVQARCIVIDKSTGETVWENTESESVPLRQSARNFRDTRNTTTINQSQTERDLSNVLQIADLATLSQEQMHAAIMTAAQSVGHKMAETLRSDIASSKKK